MMGKVKWLGALALAGLLIPVTLAQPEYENDFNTLDGITVRVGVNPPYVYTDPYTGDTGVVADTGYNNNDPNQGLHTGYQTMDIDFGVTGANPVDFSVGEFQVSYLWQGSNPPPGIVGFWLRVYSGNYVQDPNTGTFSWQFSGGQNYFFEVNPNTGFNTFTRNVSDFQETNWLGTFIPTQVYKIRYDSVVWELPYHPYTFGIGYFAKFGPAGGSPVAQVQLNPPPPYECNCNNIVTVDGSGSFDTQDPNTGETGTVVRYVFRGSGGTILQDSDSPTYMLTPACGQTTTISLTVYDDEGNQSAAEPIDIVVPEPADRYGYVEDFTSLAGLSTAGPAENLRLVDGTGPGVEADALSQGYAEIDINPCYTVGAWHGTVSMELKVEGTQPSPFPDPVGFWLRARTPTGSKNYFENIPSDGQWHAISRAWDSADSTDAGYDGNNLTQFAIQSVVWGANVSQTFGVRNFTITGSEPTSTPPVANAGMDQLGLVNTSYDGMTVTLDGSGSTDDLGIVRYVWKEGNTTISDGPNPTTNINLGAGTYTFTLYVYDAEQQVDSDDVMIEITDDITVIASDELATDFSTYLGDVYGRSSSETIPVTFDENTPFEIINERKISDAPSQPGTFCFDEAGNLYWTAWNGYIESQTKNLAPRWISSVSTGHGDANWNTGPLVGKRYVYGVGGEVENTIATAFAFDKGTGELVWKVPLLVDTGGAEPVSVEPPDWYARKILYNNRIFILGNVGTTGPSGSAMGGWLWIYVVNCGDGVNPGFLESASYVNMGEFANGFPPASYSGRHPGNLVYVPDAFPSSGFDGLYWTDWSGSDFYSDMFCAAVDPATSMIVEGWGPDIFTDGPYQWRTDVLYSPRSNIVYTPGYNDNDLYSIMAWDPKGTDGQFDIFSPPLLGAMRLDIANSGHTNANMLDDNDPNYTRVHCHGNFGSLTTWAITDTDPFNFTIQPSVRMFGTGADTLGLFAADLKDTAHDRTVAVTSVRNQTPAQLVSMDLTVDPNLFTSDDGPMYWDNIVIKVDGAVVASQDFESYTEGFLLENDPNWQLDDDGDPQHSPQITTFDGSKVLVMNPVSNIGNVPREGIKWWYGTVTLSPATRVTVEWDQWREELSENIDIFLYDGANFGIFQWDVDQLGTLYSDEGGDQHIALVPRTWQHIVMDINHGTYTITADGAHVGGNAAQYSGEYNPTSFVLWMYGTEPTSNGQPYIQKWVDPEPLNPATNLPWSALDRGPVPGPDGTFYALQFQSYDRRMLRIGAPQTPPPLGACCLGDASDTCVVTDQATCEISYGGTYQGDDSLCSPVNPCAAPQGCRGDYDCSGSIDFFDIDLLLAALGGEQSWIDKYQQKYGTLPTCNYSYNCDANGDGTVDFFDIDAFLGLLGTSCP